MTTFLLRFRVFAICVPAFLVLVSSIGAQDDSVRRAVANLQQDMQALNKRVGELQLEVEALRSENRRLRSQVERVQAQGGNQSEIMRVVESRLQSLRAEITRSEAEHRRKLGDEISAQIERLAQRFQERLQEVARGAQARPGPVADQPTFSSDFPKNGIQHTVVPGDTLSHLAARYDSRVDWIRNANQIANPSRDLRVGQTIFIPQE